MKILIPFKINRLADPEPMPSHDQDKRGIPMPVAALASGADELAYLASLTLPALTSPFRLLATILPDAADR